MPPPRRTAAASCRQQRVERGGEGEGRGREGGGGEGPEVHEDVGQDGVCMA